MKTLRYLFLFILPFLPFYQSLCGDSSLFENGFCLPSRGFGYPNCYQRFPKVNETIPEDFTVAFFGDQGLSETSKSVLSKIQSKGADLVIHAGDFDYSDNPDAWDDQINDILGENFMYLPSAGNRDLKKWEGKNGYQSKIFNRLIRTGARCMGSVGLSMFCSVSGLTFFFGAPGLEESLILQNTSSLSEIIESGFNQFGGPWRFCVWHFNQRDYQIGSKSDEVGWEMYEKCRELGAVIITAHDHSYARTYLLSHFENHTVSSTSSNVSISLGESIALVIGTGGRSIVPCEDDLELNPWWAKALCSSSDPPLNFGSLFCSFNYLGLDQNSARCWFEEIDGIIRDEFFLESNVSASECCQPDVDRYCFEDGVGSFSVPFLRRTCEENITSNCGFEVSCGCSSGDSCFDASCWCTSQTCSEVEGKECFLETNECIFTQSSSSSSSGLNDLEIAFISIASFLGLVIILFPIFWIAYVLYSSRKPQTTRRR